MDAVQEKNKSQFSVVCRTHSNPFSALHWHYNYEICRVLDNAMRFMINGVPVEAKAGDIVMIEENVAHQFLTPYGATQVCIIQFSPKILLEADIPVKGCKVHISAEEIAGKAELAWQLNLLFELINGEGEVRDNAQNHYVKCMVAALYCLLTRHFGEDRKKDELSSGQIDFLRILEYINNHFEEDINVKILADRLFMYRGRVSALFRKYSNMSITEYVYSLRIKKANELLEQGSSIIDAALQSGFQNVRTFNRIYKKTLGMTPTEYKKMYE